MYHLVIDASTSSPFVLIAQDDTPLFFSLLQDQKGSSSLIPAIQKGIIATHLQYQDLSHITLGIGPGSFIGLRSASTVAKMFRLSLKIPLFSFHAMQAIAPSPTGVIAHLLDGKQRGIFIALLERKEQKMVLLQKPQLTPLNDTPLILDKIEHLYSIEPQPLFKKGQTRVQEISFDPNELAKIGLHAQDKSLSLLY